MTTQAAILAELNTALAAVHTAREPASTFVLIGSDLPFAESPGEAESFAVRVVTFEDTEMFGQVGVKEISMQLEVLLGHPAFESEDLREQSLVQDVNKVKDVLEFRAWSTSGVQAAFTGTSTVDRSNASWWVSSIPVQVIFLQAVNATP